MTPSPTPSGADGEAGVIPMADSGRPSKTLEDRLRAEASLQFHHFREYAALLLTEAADRIREVEEANERLARLGRVVERERDEAIEALKRQSCADGDPARPDCNAEPSASGEAPLTPSERHELECLRHQVGQLEYPCSPHCEGYLRELAMRNGGTRP